MQKNDKGYLLIVESGRIDHGHHAGNAKRALADAVELSNAVKAAVENTNPEETLILVTADHSHVFTIAGYPKRGNPILGLVHGVDGNLSTASMVSHTPPWVTPMARAQLWGTVTT